MDEESLESSIETYQLQLDQVNQAIQAAGETDDLVTLRNDLHELINLTKDSLLSLKKSVLLRQLDDDDHAGEGSRSDGACGVSNRITASNSSSHIDDEYAAFQAMLGDDVTQTSEMSKMEPEQSNIEELDRSINELYSDVVGTKCRAPFIQSWGEKRYSNALIVGIDDKASDEEIPKVKVMFCNPTHQAMLPCKYYLEGGCKFSEENCRCSHGYLVALEDLQEYEEPDYSSLKLESKCLACYEDDLWYKATVVDISDDVITVMFDSYEDEAVPLPIQDVLPVEHLDETESEDEDEPTKDEDSEDEQDSLPVFLWKPPSHGIGDLGLWEEHTRGIGSKLLTKMGYEPGKGLGKVGEGRILPVPIQLLPQGKSLDTIMRLKEMAGDREMFDAMKKMEKRAKKQKEQIEKGYKVKESPSVFDFINTKLRGKKGNLSELFHKHEGKGHKGKEGQGHKGSSKTISEHDLNKRSERSINIQVCASESVVNYVFNKWDIEYFDPVLRKVQKGETITSDLLRDYAHSTRKRLSQRFLYLLKTSEEMKSVEKEMERLKQSLTRNENSDKNMAAQVRSKIKSLEQYRDKLVSSEQTMQTHQKKRSDHRKLTVF